MGALESATMAAMTRSFALAALLTACGNAATPAPAAGTATATAAHAPSAPAVPPHEEVKTVVVPAAITAIVDAQDRTADDRALDTGRHPGETLAFFGVAPGMKVAEIAAGRGYTTELLARAVGPGGKVYAVNNKKLLGFVGEEWDKRLASPAMKNVTRLDREFDDPFPEGVTGLDLVVDVLFYHDTYWMKVDREKMNRAVFAALKPGGVYGIVDHNARDGAGDTEVQTTHRIEEATLVADVLKAGFKLSSEASFLRNPSDTRDWNDSPRAAGEKRGTSDRFVLKFVRP